MAEGGQRGIRISPLSRPKGIHRVTGNVRERLEIIILGLEVSLL